MLDTQHTLFQRLCRDVATEAGAFQTPVEDVVLFRRDAPSLVGNTLYKPAVFVVLQGAKQATIGPDVLIYDEDHYLVISVPSPVVSEITRASSSAPFLSLKFELDIELLRALLVQVEHQTDETSPQRGLVCSPMTDALKDATRRLIRLFWAPEDAQVLGALYKREILYHILKGPQGDFLRSLVLGQGKQYEISTVLMALHKDCAQSFTVAQLAATVNMSESVFYEAFKAVTASSPMQYVKRLRLLEAHRKLSLGLANVSEVAYEVGYNSTSQFSREFKRFYGHTPSHVQQAANTI